MVAVSIRLQITVVIQSKTIFHIYNIHEHVCKRKKSCNNMIIIIRKKVNCNLNLHIELYYASGSCTIWYSKWIYLFYVIIWFHVNFPSKWCLINFYFFFTCFVCVSSKTAWLVCTRWKLIFSHLICRHFGVAGIIEWENENWCRVILIR